MILYFVPIKSSHLFLCLCAHIQTLDQDLQKAVLLSFLVI